MSRIGLKPIVVPAGVTVTVGEGNHVTVKGPLGTLEQSFSGHIAIDVQPGVVTLSRDSEEQEVKALHGLTRAIIHNMVEGVVNGYQKNLEIEGVGYKAEKQGSKLVMKLGYSHDVVIPETDDYKFECPSATQIVVKGIDKQKVGEIAAQVRGKRPPEPYKGKGIRYAGEHIRRKAGKTGK
ncbi:MAG: 50S ribosomal protein L6 [Clostridia bacterium]|nr:50S ribosomal protein L6 [Clostridia bacterium]MBQ4297211.1 50S ribosomal protein L6 [Clostridia bacterium]